MYSQRENDKKKSKRSSPKEITTVYTLSKQIRQTAPIVAIMVVKTMTAIVQGSDQRRRSEGQKNAHAPLHGDDHGHADTPSIRESSRI